MRNAVQAGGGRASTSRRRVLRTSEGIEWWVRDDGRGFSETQQGRMFECFAGGAGMGLFLVRQLVAGWGGAVRVQSEPGARYDLHHPRANGMTPAAGNDGIL